MEIFDREFPERFPGIVFSRFLNEVFISTRGCKAEVIFDEKAGHALLKELGLAGEIVSIGPGDEPLSCCRQILFLDSNGGVRSP